MPPAADLPTPFIVPDANWAAVVREVLEHVGIETDFPEGGVSHVAIIELVGRLTQINLDGYPEWLEGLFPDDKKP